MEVAGRDSERELEGIFERNMATRVSKQPKTSALCKNNLSNYEERLLAFLSRMLYCGRTPPTSLSSDIHLLYIFRCRHTLLLIM